MTSWFDYVIMTSHLFPP